MFDIPYEHRRNGHASARDVRAQPSAVRNPVLWTKMFVKVSVHCNAKNKYH